MSKEVIKLATKSSHANGSIEPDSRPTQDGNWADSLSILLDLATKANEAFNFDEAIELLNTAQGIWETKDFPEFSIELRLRLHSQKGKALASEGRHEEALEEYRIVLS